MSGFHPPASQILPRADLDLTPPHAVSFRLSQTQLTVRPQRNVRLPARVALTKSSAAFCLSQLSVAFVPLSQPLEPAL